MNQEIKKLVNIYPTMPVTRVTPPLRTVAKHVSRSIGYIRSCIMCKALVEEILPDGTTVRLGLHNYNKDNYVSKAPVEEPIVSNVEEEPAVEPVVSNVEEPVEEPVVSNVEESVVEPENSNVEEVTVESEKSAWDIAYENALAGKDLESMTKKQRKDTKAKARAIADAAVNGTSEVAEEASIVVDDTVANEEIVETVDIENLSEVTE